jgi:ABC-2 type transport system ATP-binding protein
MLRALAADGVAVFLSSHRLDEVENACDRIVVVTDGAVRFDGAVADLSGDGRFAGAVRSMLESNATSPDDAPDDVRDVDDHGFEPDRGTT